MTITTFWGTSINLLSTQPGWVTPNSGDLSTPPASLDPMVFRTWDLDYQIRYLQLHGSGDPLSVELGPPLTAVTATLAPDEALTLRLPSQSGQPGAEFTVQQPGRDATAAELATPPGQLDPSVFLSWTGKDRIAYLQQQGSPAVIGGASNPKRIFASLSPEVQFFDGPILRTSGDYEPIPYYYLTGSASGTPSAVVQESAERLFPTLDGDTATLPVEQRPDAFYTSPSSLTTDAQKTAFLDSFSTWHTAYQLEYIKKYGSNGVLDIQVANPPARMTAVVSLSDPAKVIVVQSLDKNAVAKLTLVEQNQIAALPAFTALAGSLGLSAKASAQLPSVDDPSRLLSMSGYIDELADTIRTRTATNLTANPNIIIPGYPSPVFQQAAPANPTDANGGPYIVTNGDFAGVVRYREVGPSFWQLEIQPTMPPSGQAPFLAELDLLKEQLARGGIVSPAEIQKKVMDLRNRFDRAYNFYNVRPPSTSQEWIGDPPHLVDVYHNVISLDDNETINHGYQVFIAQEKKIAELAETRMQLVRDDGVAFGKRLDVPSLIARFQMIYSESLKAQVVMETEEINQQNALLKTYAAMQDLVNQTLQQFVKADDDPKGILGLGEGDYEKLTDEQKKVLGMFEDALGAGQKHPLETQGQIDRPLFDFFKQDAGEADNYKLNAYSQTQWSTFGTRLSETVTLINQNTQIKMNDITSLQKEADRHFDLAANALAKLADIIQNIGRI